MLNCEWKLTVRNGGMVGWPPVKNLQVATLTLSFHISTSFEGTKKSSKVYFQLSKRGGEERVAVA